MFYEGCSREDYDVNGFTVFKNALYQPDLDRIREKAIGRFYGGMNNKYVYSDNDESVLFRLKDKDFSRFKNCGLTSQNMSEIFKLMSSSNFNIILNEFLWMWSYAITTKPVLLFSHPLLNEATKPHQDHGSMLAGGNSHVMWIPLVDCDKDDIGPLQVARGSHKLGNIWDRYEGSFALVERELDFEPVYAKVGDIILFNSKLVHKSGANTSDRIRWSLSYRFADQEWINSGYLSPYQYKSIAYELQ